MNRSIVLVGHSGIGKTTLGKQLADKLGWMFYDSDNLLVSMAVDRFDQYEVPTLMEAFSMGGEEWFVEADIQSSFDLIHNFPSETVISLSGSAFMDEDVREAVRAKKSLSVWLHDDATDMLWMERYRKRAKQVPIVGLSNPPLNSELYELVRKRNEIYSLAEIKASPILNRLAKAVKG